jgi:hypothetical protein
MWRIPVFHLVIRLLLTYFLNNLGSRWAESFEEAVKSPFDSEQDEGLADSSININEDDIDLQFQDQNV